MTATNPWLPISEAPKGNRFVRILAAGPHHRADYGDPYVVDIILWSFTWKTREVSAGNGLYRKEQYKENEGWRRMGDYGERPIDFDPVCWMPLPDPPTGDPSQ